MTIRRFILRTTGSLTLCLLVGCLSIVSGQEKNQLPAAPPSSCSRENALDIIQQQILAARIFENEVQRITVLIRAADLLWPLRQDKARSAFSEAFEVAQHNFKEKGDADERDGKLLVSVPDQRYSVLSAIAKRDAVWAKKLTDQMLKEQQQESDDKPNNDPQKDTGTAEKLLTAAFSLLSADKGAALGFARNSLQYPATVELAIFLYQLSTADRAAADQFYQEALSAYASAPMERLLYLSAFPFGNNRDAGDMPGWTIYRVPAGFIPNPILQRFFVQTILRRVEDYVSNPTDKVTSNHLSDPGQMLLALTRLSLQIQQSLPDLAPAVEAAKGNLLARTTADTQQRITDKVADDNPTVLTFEERVEAASKNPNADRRDEGLTSAITSSASASVSLDAVLSAVDKISDSAIRQPLLNWFFFERAQRSIKDKKLDEARKLAARVDELDQRAYLDSSIAEELIKQNPDQTEARDVLEEVVTLAAKAPSTTVTARALMSVAHLYVKIDVNRSVAIMAEAVKCINRIEKPDFSRQVIPRKIEGKTFGTYAMIQTPGFSPENAFREIGKTDFDGMLSLASNFTDKSLRATTTLALVETCLQQLSKPEKPAVKAKATSAKP
jgi:hypothetical protein